MAAITASPNEQAGLPDKDHSLAALAHSPAVVAALGRSLAYRRTYDKLSSSFLSLGDAFVEEVLKLHPEV